MNKIKNILKKIIIVLITLLPFTLFFSVMHDLYIGNTGYIGGHIALLGISVAILTPILRYLLKTLEEVVAFELKLFDEHFVDRDIEYNTIKRMIHQQNERIIYITGRRGMGKTHFAKMLCDKVNFHDVKEWTKYSAFYYQHDKKQKIEIGLSKLYNLEKSFSIVSLSKFFHTYPAKKHCILIIDNIGNIEKNDAVEFAKAFIGCNTNNVVILVIDSADMDADIYPSKFEISEIQLLADSFNVNIPEKKQQQFSEMSCGYPVYARFNVEAYSKGKDADDFTDMSQYIEKLIEALNPLRQDILSLIIIITQMIHDAISMEELTAIDRRITKACLNDLALTSLIQIHKDKIYVDNLIGNICMGYLSEYIDDNYRRIYTHYVNIYDYNYLALSAALHANCAIDINFVCEQLEVQYNKGNFYLLVTFGKLDSSNKINAHVRENRECWTKVKYFYLKSLLELGLYNEARETVDNANQYFNNCINIMSINSTLDFEYQYALIDLEHLTNHFEDACLFSEALIEKATDQNQSAKCQYLNAHCLRHMGNELDKAYDIFINLGNSNEQIDDKIKLRSLYSAASIKMFQNDLSYSYKKIFEQIDDILNANPDNDIWRPYVNRHKAIYTYTIKQNYRKAEEILLKTIKQLEVTSLRIKYDIYFELAEVYRLYYEEQDSFKKSMEYYKKATDYADSVGDINLLSNCQMGIILLQLKYDCYDSDNNIDDIIEKTKKCKLNINYNNAIYIQHLLCQQEINDELILYWEKLKYADLSFTAKNKSAKYNLKLTVM